MNGRSCSSSAVSDRGMESDSVFHSLLGCMELLPGLQAVFAIPNMNALPVHCANQVFREQTPRRVLQNIVELFRLTGHRH